MPGFDLWPSGHSRGFSSLLPNTPTLGRNAGVSCGWSGRTSAPCRQRSKVGRSDGVVSSDHCYGLVFKRRRHKAPSCQTWVCSAPSSTSRAGLARSAATGHRCESDRHRQGGFSSLRPAGASGHDCLIATAACPTRSAQAAADALRCRRRDHYPDLRSRISFVLLAIVPILIDQVKRNPGAGKPRCPDGPLRTLYCQRTRDGPVIRGAQA